MTKKPKIIKAWGGFAFGRLATETFYPKYIGTTVITLAIYRTKKEALSSYVDVRRIEIRMLKK